MKLTKKQTDLKDLIEKISEVIGMDKKWAVGIAMTESSLGMNQKSPTGCKGVFQMSSIAMKELHRLMLIDGYDTVDTLCGIAYLFALLMHHKTKEEATNHFCDPKDKGFYWDRVQKYMKEIYEE